MKNINKRLVTERVKIVRWLVLHSSNYRLFIYSPHSGFNSEWLDDETEDAISKESKRRRTYQTIEAPEDREFLYALAIAINVGIGFQPDSFQTCVHHERRVPEKGYSYNHL